MPATAHRPAAMPPAPEIRDSLFGDLALHQWPSDKTSAHEPWRSFVRARDALAEGDDAVAIATWQRIVEMPELESRHYAQAWHFLREHDVTAPAEKSKQLLGVILEVSMNEGVDLLAAYPDRSARYYNYSGAGVIWERADDSLDAPIDALLAAGQRVLNAISPWHDPRPLAPPPGQVRMNFLSPAGLHFGQATFQTLASNDLAHPVINAGMALMQALAGKGRR